MAQPSRIQQFQRLNRAALPHRMMMMTQNSHLPHLEEDDSVHRSSKRSFHGCLNSAEASEKRVTFERCLATCNKD